MNKLTPQKADGAKRLRKAPLTTPSDLKAAANTDIAAAMNDILADVFAIYLKTKNFHWHMSRPHFREYRLMLDEQGDQLFAMTDPIAERIRKVGGTTLRSIGHISRTQRVLDNDADYVEPLEMLAELRDDNKTRAANLREAHSVCYRRTGIINGHEDPSFRTAFEELVQKTGRRHVIISECASCRSRPISVVRTMAKIRRSGCDSRNGWRRSGRRRPGRSTRWPILIEGD